ncbi:MAG: ParB/RepB/Spo0J family partition protein [Oscillospiraceae bacterium]|nr:ParB/RepB/Spo0J family partition protein [Oscillospiraceae bacterium]
MKKTKEQFIRKEKITYLPLGKIVPNSRQPRRKFEPHALNELAASIKENGLLQPVTVRKTETDYMLVAGERRFRAAHIAGLSKIPCIVIDADDQTSATLTLLENLQRSDLDFFEEAEGIAYLMKICTFTQEQVAKKLGKSQSAISNKLRLLKLGRDIISAISLSSLSERHARALLRLQTEDERKAALTHIIENKLNVYQTDEYIDSLISSKNEVKKREREARQQYIIKDVRLFYNTVGKAVETMRRAGFKADISRDEDETSINMSIKIYK